MPNSKTEARRGPGYTAPPTMGIRRVEPLVIKSRVDRIYDILLQTLTTGQKLEEVFEVYLPLLLNEIDKLLYMYPEIAPSLLREIVRGLWERQFPQIPPPEFTKEDSAHTIFEKVSTTLTRYAKKLVPPAKGYRSEAEEVALARIAALKFMDAVCSTFFTLMGVSL